MFFLNQTSWTGKCVFHSMNIFSNHLASFLPFCQTAHAPENVWTKVTQQSVQKMEILTTSSCRDLGLWLCIPHNRALINLNDQIIKWSIPCGDILICNIFHFKLITRFLEEVQLWFQRDYISVFRYILLCMNCQPWFDSCRVKPRNVHCFLLML